MNVAISNIAWRREEAAGVADLLKELGVKGIEIAPTMVWPKPLEASDSAIRDHRRFWESRAMRVVAMQSLLYGRPDLTLFESEAKREETLAYLEGVMSLGGKLGARALVFGSPKNRFVGNLAPEEARAIAVSFFRRAGDLAAKEGTVLCIEPNPPRYGCDFIRTIEEGRDLVGDVASPGFGLHLDAAAITLSGEKWEEPLAKAAPGLCHFHASEPDLAAIGSGRVDHERFGQALRRAGYKNWVSIEMRASQDGPNAGRVRAAIERVLRAYG